MKKQKKQTPYIVLLLLVLLAALFCSLFCFQLLLIQGDSMEPNYHSGQLRLLSKLDKDYERADCILFYCEGLECNLVKRIAALPGDRVQIVGGQLFINGEQSSPYPGSPAIEQAGLATRELTVPEGHYFVLGDNFARSKDSRHKEVGLVPLEAIKGKII